MTLPLHRPLLALLTAWLTAWLLVVCPAGVARGQSSEDRLWRQTPYRVEVRIAVTGGPSGDALDGQSLVRRLEQDLAHRVGTLWDGVVLPVRRDTLAEHAATLREVSPSQGGPSGAADKTFYLAVRHAAGESWVVAREYDRSLDHWGPTGAPLVCQPEGVERAALAALLQAFRPVARYSVAADSPDEALLVFRGEELAPTLAREVRSGTLVPYRVRETRGGGSAPPQVTRVRWTFLTTVGDGLRARVTSHTRRPFGARRRGRVEQLALAWGDSPAPPPTEMWLHSVDDPSVPLVGYEVLLGEPGSDAPPQVGRSGPGGRVTLPPFDRVMMAHVRYGGVVVASLPVAPGVDRVIETPLLNERQRLRAELRLGALREELIDVVARREILAARVRRSLDGGEADEAERLVRQIEALPGRVQFNQRLNSAEQSLRADHPLVQRQIDRLLAETRSVLAASLDARRTRDLSSEVLRAQRAGESVAPRAGAATP